MVILVMLPPPARRRPRRDLHFQAGSPFRGWTRGTRAPARRRAAKNAGARGRSPPRSTRRAARPSLRGSRRRASRANRPTRLPRLNLTLTRDPGYVERTSARAARNAPARPQHGRQRADHTSLQRRHAADRPVRRVLAGALHCPIVCLAFETQETEHCRQRRQADRPLAQAGNGEPVLVELETIRQHVGDRLVKARHEHAADSRVITHCFTAPISARPDWWPRHRWLVCEHRHESSAAAPGAPRPLAAAILTGGRASRMGGVRKATLGSRRHVDHRASARGPSPGRGAGVSGHARPSRTTMPLSRSFATRFPIMARSAAFIRRSSRRLTNARWSSPATCRS